MDDATDRILEKLAEQSLPTPEKVRFVRALGRLGTPKAIAYLLDNHTFTEDTPFDVGRARLPVKPCKDALMDAGVPAVPRIVEAYCTWPPEKDPGSLLSIFLKQHRTQAERSRVAYILAQGYLFAYQEKHFHRERTLELIYSLVPHATDMEGGAMTYPAPWMPNPGMPEKPTKRP